MQHKPHTPHLSLLYADMDDAAKDKVVAVLLRWKRMLHQSILRSHTAAIAMRVQCVWEARRPPGRGGVCERVYGRMLVCTHVAALNLLWHRLDAVWIVCVHISAIRSADVHAICTSGTVLVVAAGV